MSPMSCDFRSISTYHDTVNARENRRDRLGLAIHLGRVRQGRDGRGRAAVGGRGGGRGGIACDQSVSPRRRTGLS